VGAPLSALTNSTKFPSAAFYAEHAGTGDVALSARITNASNTNPALFGESAGSGAGVMGIKRAGQAGVPILGRNDGTGEGAGTFRVTDNANVFSALYAETNGTGSGVLGIAHGNGSSTRGLKLAGANGAAVVGEHRGISGNAGLFQITNADNSSAAVRAETNGTAPAVDAFASGTAPAINVIKPEGSSGQGIYIDHQGASGPVAQFRRTNPNAVGVTIIGSNNSVNSPSLAMYALHEGTGDAAFVARINNAQNAFAASYAETNGSGSALFANQLGTGRAAQIQINNVANSQIALRAFTNGTGKAARITTANPGNSDTATMVETNGSGPAFAAVQTGSGIGGVFASTGSSAGVPLRVINNSAQNGTYALEVIQNSNGTGTDALFVAKNNGTGSAGNFWNNNASNDGSNLFSATNAPNGIAIGAMNTANGFAYAAWGGGIRVSSHTVAAGTNIATRATAYLINGGGPYTFGFTLAEGEMMMIYNNTASAVTVGGVSIPANSGKTCVVLEGILRPM
jgi:hypothetical protein